MAIKPNTICKNPNCTKGKNGGRKHYYTCYTCIKNTSWHTVACCKECFEEYLQAIENRKLKNETMKPKRTDISEKEVDKIINEMSIEEAIKKTKAELSDYSEQLETEGLSATLDTVNAELDLSNKEEKNKTTKKRNRKKNNKTKKSGSDED